MLLSHEYPADDRCWYWCYCLPQGLATLLRSASNNFPKSTCRAAKLQTDPNTKMWEASDQRMYVYLMVRADWKQSISVLLSKNSGKKKQDFPCKYRRSFPKTGKKKKPQRGGVQGPPSGLAPHKGLTKIIHSYISH